MKTCCHCSVQSFSEFLNTDQESRRDHIVCKLLKYVSLYVCRSQTFLSLSSLFVVLTKLTLDHVSKCYFFQNTDVCPRSPLPSQSGMDLWSQIDWRSTLAQLHEQIGCKEICFASFNDLTSNHARIVITLTLHLFSYNTMLQRVLLKMLYINFLLEITFNFFNNVV